MPKPTLAQRNSFKTWLRHNKPKFANTTIPEFYLDDILSSTASGISTTDNVRVIPFNNFETVDITTDEANDTLFYLPALPGDRVTVSFGSTSVLLTMSGEDGGVIKDGSTYTLNQNIPIARGRALTVKGLGGALIQGGSTPTYSITESSTSVNEGSSVSFTVNTNHVGAGTTLFFNAIGGQVSAADFSDGSLSGSFQVVGIANTTVGVTTFVRSIATDFLNSENETFSIEIRTGSLAGPIVATSNVITIGDVVATVNVAESTTSVDEGGSVTFTISGSNIPNGNYYYTIYEEDGTIASTDFNPANLNGVFSVNNNSGSITITIAEDITSEGPDKFKIQIRTGSISGTVIAESNAITINDTSRTPGSTANGLTFGPVQVNRDDSNPGNESDWFAICDIDTLPEGSSIALFIDTSGSMTMATVQASYNKFVAKLNEKNITITTVTNSNEDRITPFIVDLP